MKTKQILGLMNVISWVTFIGLCIKTGATIISFLISLFINPDAAQNLGLDLSALYKSNIWYFVNTVSFVIILSGLKAYIFYLVIRIFLKVDFDHPFSAIAVSLISKISYVALEIGIVALVAQNYSKWLLHRGVLVEQNWGSWDYLFLAGIIFIIALVFKRGVEIQSENELTI